jgi:hypothetical protein
MKSNDFFNAVKEEPSITNCVLVGYDNPQYICELSFMVNARMTDLQKKRCCEIFKNIFPTGKVSMY